MQAALAVVHFQLRQRGDAFTLCLPPEPLIAQGSAEGLTHAVTNLLSNALAALANVPRGRLGVRVLRAADGQRVAVRVSDEGTGMTPEVARRLFESGFTTKTEGEGGTGLGLKLARRLLAAHGGTLRLVEVGEPERESWAVTEFVIELPAAEPARAPGEQGQRPQAPRRMLVVDDQPVILHMLQRSASAEGYVVTIAAGGDEANELLLSQHFEVLITDKNLPGKNGLELCRLARERNADMTIILITAYATAESARALLKLGADGYIEKPFELDELMRRVREIASAKAARGTASAEVETVVRVPGLPAQVLVCEPDPGDFEQITSTLKAMGVQVTAAADVVNALRRGTQVGGIVVATQLLTEKARQLLWQTKLARPRLRVVVISDGDSLQECILAVAVGATAELRRPLNPGELPEALVSALRRVNTP